MGILWWLAPPVAATVVAMIWAAWVGRGRDMARDQSDAALQRMATALRRELPHPPRNQPRLASRRDSQRHVRPVEPSTGVVVRPSQAGGRGSAPQHTRRSA